MDDDPSLPGMDKPAEAVAETAKAAQQIATIVKSGGEWASAVAGNLPHDLVGLLGDAVRAYRYERAVQLREGVIRRLKAKGYVNPEQLNAPPSLLIPILEAAVDEDRAQLQDLWEKLLTAACMPEKRNFIRRSFIDTIKQLDPPDALLLQHAHSWSQVFKWKAWIEANLSLDADEAILSVMRLKSLGLLEGDGAARIGGGAPEISGYQLSTAGRLFLRAVED